MADIAYRPFSRGISTPVGASQGTPLIAPQIKPTFYEWLEINGEEVFEVGTVVTNGGSSDNVYTVPKGYTFFLTHCLLSQYCNGAVGGAGVFQGGLSTYKRGILYIMCNGAINQKSHIQRDFPFPMRFEAGEIIELGNVSPNNFMSCIIWGFIVKNSILTTL